MTLLHSPDRRPTRGLLATFLSMTMLLTGCDVMSDSGSVAIVDGRPPTRVVMQIIQNSCGDSTAEDGESVSSGEVKGLAKVIDGFGIPYDERADSYTTHPSAVTDASYDANKERGVGYAGIEDHYVASLAPGQPHSPDHPEHADVGVAMFDNLTTKEEQYGCAMRWEYYNPDLSGPAVDGYMDFLRGNGSGHMQYVAVHATVSDKWVICCPYDWGPALNLPTTGGGKYANGRIGGLSPAAAEALEIDGGDGPESAMTEWWWVKNSAQVECGPVDDLSDLTSGDGSAPASSSSSSSGKGTTSSQASVLSGANGNDAVAIAPANANSFKNKMDASLQHGDLPKDKVRYIVMHDTMANTDDVDAIVRSWVDGGKDGATHFVIDKRGLITQCVPLDRIAHHAGWAGTTGNAEFGIAEERDDRKGYDGTEDYAMNAWSIGISLVHEGDGSDYPERQLNALDSLIAYIDGKLGTKPEIINHRDWSNQPGSTNLQTDCSSAFPLDEYRKSRNHNAVTTVSDAREAAEENACSDAEPDGKEGTQAARNAGGAGIAAMAVTISGTAAPKPPIHGAWDEVPTDSRLADFVKKKNEAYPGVAGWADCGRCASTAVKASGADVTFPEGDTANQFAYMSGSQKWERAGTMRTGDAPDRICKPGDVLVTEGKGHIMIYVGNEAVKKKYPQSDANFFEGSLGDYYGWCYGREHYEAERDYAIFRCVKPDNRSVGGSGTAKGSSSSATPKKSTSSKAYKSSAKGAREYLERCAGANYCSHDTILNPNPQPEETIDKNPSSSILDSHDRPKYPNLDKDAIQKLKGTVEEGEYAGLPKWRAALVEAGRSQMGVGYISTNYGPKNNQWGRPEGFGCGMFVAYCYNSVFFGEDADGEDFSQKPHTDWFCGTTPCWWNAIAENDDGQGGNVGFYEVEQKDALPGDVICFVRADTPEEEYGIGSRCVHAEIYCGVRDGQTMAMACGGGDVYPFDQDSKEAAEDAKNGSHTHIHYLSFDRTAEAYGLNGKGGSTGGGEGDGSGFSVEVSRA